MVLYSSEEVHQKFEVPHVLREKRYHREKSAVKSKRGQNFVLVHSAIDWIFLQNIRRRKADGGEKRERISQSRVFVRMRYVVTLFIYL